MNLPLIGITLDTEEPGGYSKFPWYAVRENYGAAVAAGGGLPIMLPHETHHIDSYLGAISGLLVTGGAFDVDPALFGAASRHPSIVVKSKRTEFEWAMTEGALSRICQFLVSVAGNSFECRSRRHPDPTYSR